jgi:C-terminal binding protein
LVVTPHSAFASPEAYEDIKRKSAETMRAVLIDNKLQNVIPPEAD